MRLFNPFRRQSLPEAHPALSEATVLHLPPDQWGPAQFAEVATLTEPELRDLASIMQVAAGYLDARFLDTLHARNAFLPALLAIDSAVADRLAADASPAFKTWFAGLGNQQLEDASASLFGWGPMVLESEHNPA